MSDDPVVKLVQDVFDSVGQLRKLVINQQEMIAGMSALLAVHTKGLNMHQKVLEALAAQAGIAFASTEDPPAPSNPVN